jgi:hypothetical protein
MALHFEIGEYRSRIGKAAVALQAEELAIFR